MDNEQLLVEENRSFGDILTDPFKLIFRNLKAILQLNLIYIFLPMAIGLLGFSYIQTLIVVNFDFDQFPWVLAVVCVLAILVSALHTTASTFALVRVAQEDGFESLSFPRLQEAFLSVYKKNMGFHLLIFLFGIVIGGLFVYLMMFAPVAGALLIVILSLVGFFLFFPLYYLAQCIYLYQGDKSIKESFSEAYDILKDNYGGVLGTILVAGIINSVLQYTFAIPFMLIFLLTMDFQALVSGTMSFGIVQMIQNVTVAFLSTFLIQYVGLSVYFKYFSIRENRYGFNMLERIAAIGETNQTYFENEGEF